MNSTHYAVPVVGFPDTSNGPTFNAGSTTLKYILLIKSPTREIIHVTFLSKSGVPLNVYSIDSIVKFVYLRYAVLKNVI